MRNSHIKFLSKLVLIKWMHFQLALFSWELQQITDMFYVREIAEKFLSTYIVYVFMLLYNSFILSHDFARSRDQRVM